MSEELKIGYLKSSDESLISSVSIKTGQIIYSEEPGVQFVDFEGTRHTYGSVLSGLFVGNEYKDFSTLELNDIIDVIKENNEIIKNGQLIKIGKSIYMYKKVNDNNFIVQLNETSNKLSSANQVGYAIHLPAYLPGDMVNMSLLMSVSSNSLGNKIFLVQITDNVIDLANTQDLDGVFDASTLGVTITNHNGLFVIASSVSNIVLKVVSYSVTSSGSSVNEGFYVVASDIVASV